jgi:hypothetical protein
MEFSSSGLQDRMSLQISAPSSVVGLRSDGMAFPKISFAWRMGHWPSVVSIDKL